MNSLDLSFWTRLLGVLAMESALVVGLMFLIERFVKNTYWRRTLWQLAMVLLLALTLSELSGFGRGATAWLLVSREPIGAVQTPAIHVASQATVSVEEPTFTPVSFKAAVPPSQVWWPGILWSLGAGAVLLRVLFAEGLLLMLRLRCKGMTQVDLVERTAVIAKRLGIRRRIQLLEVSRVKSPVAFGGVRPAIGLPAGFIEKFDTVQQDAMLAHELAHIAGGDPLWYRVGDLATAFLWWHPLVWWARRRLHVCSELRADEATVLLENGPLTLAECLVTLGRELTTTSHLAWIGIEGGGFKSHLGQRVERLLNLKSPDKIQSRFSGFATLKTILVISCVAAAVILSGWILLDVGSQQQSLKDKLSHPWNSSARATVGAAALQKPDTKQTAMSGDQPLQLFSKTFSLTPHISDRSLECLGITTNDTVLAYHEGFRALVASVGIDLFAPKSIFCNRKGMMLARASLRDLDTLSGVVEVLNSDPYVMIYPSVPTKALNPGDLDQLEMRTFGVAIAEAQTKLHITTTGAPATLQALCDALFQQAGVNMKSPGNLAVINGSGMLFTRASKQELDAIEATIKKLAVESFVSGEGSSAVKMDGNVIPSSSSLSGLVEQGRSYFETGLFDKSEELFTKALALDPKNKTALYYLKAIKQKTPKAGISQSSKSIPGADSGVETANRDSLLKLNPSSTEDLIYNGKLYLKTDRFDLATEMFRNVLAREPKNNMARYNLDLIKDKKSHGIQPLPENPADLTSSDTGLQTSDTKTYKISPQTAVQGLMDNRQLKGDLHARLQLLFQMAGLELNPTELLFSSDKPEIFRVHTTKAGLKVIDKLVEVINEGGLTLYPADAAEKAIVGWDSKLDLRELRMDPTIAEQWLHLPEVGVSQDNLSSLCKGLCEKAGVNLNVPGKFALMNQTGSLLLRATPKEIDLVWRVLDEFHPQLIIESKFVEMSDAILERTHVKLEASSVGDITNFVASGIASDVEFLPQLTAILRRSDYNKLLEIVRHRPGVNIQSTPKVTTLSGRQTHISCKEMITLPPSFGAKDPLGVGVSLNVSAVVQADGYTVHLASIPEIVGFNPKLKPAVFHSVTASNRDLRDGQTLMVGGLKTRDDQGKEKNLVVFITVTLIDHAGNLMHSNAE